MAADVLLYNALNEENKKLLKQIQQIDANISSQNSICSSAISTIETNTPTIVKYAGPNQANVWCLIPTLAETGCPWTGDLKVCDTEADFRCGKCCLWTVPAGVSCARFQIWGAGAGRGYVCCCGFIPFGGTGAYASVIIPVTPGDTYTLCAGCAYCCYACNNNTNVNGQPGCQSFVVGNNISNFCAEGGEASLFCELQVRNTFNQGVSGQDCRYLGSCICSNASVCFRANKSGTPSCCWDNIFPMIASCKTFYGSSLVGTVYGISGAFGSIAVNCNGSICAQHPPIYGFPTTSCCVALITNSDQGGICCRSCNNILVVPGAGSWAQMQCGGCIQRSGDAGRAGMVCVSYL